MKSHTLREIIEFKNALASGKIVEHQNKEIQQGWSRTYGLLENKLEIIDQYEFRIVPTPKLRPWKAKEVPVGALVRNKVSFCEPPNPNSKALIIGVENCGDIITGNMSPSCAGRTAFGIRPDYLMLTAEYSKDNGATWLPCGVETTE